MKFSLAASLGIVTAPLSSADIPWPEYSQQCADDAGPPYSDDDPNTFYHNGSAAYPVLNNRECADPIKYACSVRPDFKTAYLEGPISCGDNGWYCRIFNDEANGWPSESLMGDVNFGQCNSLDGFDDAGYDQDGHCHGSSVDSTYYWWIRDHWHRGYNGKVRCCCGWYQGGTQPLYGGRIANRCDYRRLVVDENDASTCRDANEGHNLGFDDVGCDRQYMSQIGSPIPEDDSVCWEIERFGYTEDTYNIPTLEPTFTPKPTSPPVVKPDTPSPTTSLDPTSPNTTPDPTKSPVKSTPIPTNSPSKGTPSPTRKPTDAPTSSPTKSPVTLPPTKSPQTNSPNPGENPGEDQRALVCGRGYNCSEGQFDIVEMIEVHNVRCCRECIDDSCYPTWKQQCGEFDPEVRARSEFDGTCYREDFCGAMDVCADEGGRLCTPEEVLERCTKSTGCGYDSTMIWACMYEEGFCEWDVGCCSGKCSGEDGEGGQCLPADPNMCG